MGDQRKRKEHDQTREGREERSVPLPPPTNELKWTTRRWHSLSAEAQSGRPGCLFRGAAGGISRQRRRWVASPWGGNGCVVGDEASWWRERNGRELSRETELRAPRRFSSASLKFKRLSHPFVHPTQSYACGWGHRENNSFATRCRRHKPRTDHRLAGMSKRWGPAEPDFVSVGPRVSKICFYPKRGPQCILLLRMRSSI